MQINYSYESTPLGTAGPLALINGLDSTFLVMNADVLTNLKYDDLLRFHKEHGATATIAAYAREVKINLGVILPDGNFCVKDYVEKPVTTHLVSMGVYVFEPQVLSYITP